MIYIRVFSSSSISSEKVWPGKSMIVYLTILPGKQQQTPFFLVLILSWRLMTSPFVLLSLLPKTWEKKE